MMRDIKKLHSWLYLAVWCTHVEKRDTWWNILFNKKLNDIQFFCDIVPYSLDYEEPDGVIQCIILQNNQQHKKTVMWVNHIYLLHTRHRVQQWADLTHLLYIDGCFFMFSMVVGISILVLCR
jgi:hypothetical protein